MSKNLGLVLGLLVFLEGVLIVVLFRTTGELEKRLAVAEKKGSTPQTVPKEGEPEVAERTDPWSVAHPPDEAFNLEEAETARRSTSPAAADPPEDAPLGPQQEAAIEKAVERALARREESSAAPRAPRESPIEVLDRELKLSPSQRLRIEELMGKRNEDVLALFSGGAGNLLEAANRAKELDAQYDEAIKAELTTEQALRYTELKKSGRIPGGVQVRVGTSVEERDR